MKKIITCFLIILNTTIFGTFPVAYQGRFHPSDVYMKQSLREIYHRGTIKQTHQRDFSNLSQEEILWKLHYDGIDAFLNAPLIYIQSAYLKKSLGLQQKKSHFSYQQIHHNLVENKETGTRFAAMLIQDQMHDYTSTSPVELTILAKGIWAQPVAKGIKIVSIPSEFPWAFLQPGDILDHLIGQKPNKEALEIFLTVQRLKQSPSGSHLELSIQDRLRLAGHDFRALPYKAKPGEWISLKALTDDIPNFTPYPDPLFFKIKSAYMQRDTKNLSQLLDSAYAQIAGSPYLEAGGKVLHYPFKWQLKAESLLFRYPWLMICAALYGIAFLSGLVLMNRFSLTLAICAFILHAAILGIRCCVLERPPVSNMFETVIYVPWIAMLGGFIMRYFSRDRWLILSASLINTLLLILLEVTQLNNRLDNVQPVLDSQYWLIIHVLMIVGSYGMFTLAGVMGHVYLISRMYSQKESKSTQLKGSQILQAMYLGIALLIPGTILGGVWAAESWGRFWDWDPKESWAFISSCIYLIWIHAFRFGHIRYDGLAVGAVTGLMSISFTWYGVNYILGAGFHSYGFGSGGEIYYYGYLLFEMIFLAVTFAVLRKTKASCHPESR